jgi:lipopolysaccharide export system permease protein
VKLVDRHLSGEFLRAFTFSALAFLAVFLMVEFFENLRMLLTYKPQPKELALYFAARIPLMLFQLLPMAALVGALVSLTLLSRRGEITAFRCGGVPLARLAAPYLVCGLLISFFQVLLQEVISPRATGFAEEVKQIRIRKRPARSLLHSENVWLLVDQRIVHVGKVAPERDHLLTVAVAELENHAIVRRVDAREAVWQEGGWTFYGVEDRTFPPSGEIRVERAEEMRYPLPMGPEEFRIEKRAASELPWGKLKRQVDRLKAQGLPSRDLEMGLWAKTSLPFTSLVMPLIGLPFALRTDRRGGASVGIALGLVLGFSYWLVLAVGMSLGKAGVLPPPLAAWVGNLVFLAAGTALLWRAERRA